MSSDCLIRVAGLGKNFRLYKSSKDRLLELFGARNRGRDFAALSGINLDLRPGEALGIIGENGSGKSTLLKLIAGILIPDAGKIEKNGKITGLFELGAGFNPELSGRRNIYLNGVYLNLPRERLAERETEIIEFAELGEFIDEPLKSYSSGMAMRLGFAVAIHADPQCFVIDEALSVGDARFQQKCYERLRAFRREGGAILFVSHDLAAVKMLCDRVMLLDHGKARFLGDPEEAVNRFNEILAAKGDSGAGPGAGYGNGDIRFVSARTLNAAGRPARVFISGEPMRAAFEWECARPASQVTFGVTLRDRFGQDVFGVNGALLNTQIDVSGPGSGSFDFSSLALGKGQYTINLAAHTGTTHLEKCFHWWDNAATFEVLEDPGYRFGGIARLETKLRLNPHEKI